jgi:hypothetical protein
MDFFERNLSLNHIYKTHPPSSGCYLRNAIVDVNNCNYVLMRFRSIPTHIQEPASPAVRPDYAFTNAIAPWGYNLRGSQVRSIWCFEYRIFVKVDVVSARILREEVEEALKEGRLDIQSTI